MQFDQNITNEEKINNDNKQYFITDENFQLLKKIQQQIFEATEVSPALRKIVNELITAENLEIIKNKFIEIWNN